MCKYTMLASFAGVVSALAVIPPYGWVVGIISGAILLNLLYHATPRNGAWYGFTYGVSLVGITLLWWFSVIPMTSSGIESVAVSAVLVFFVWLFASAVMACASALFGYVVARTRPGVAVLASLWVASEVLRSLLHATLVIWGPENIFGAHWTFAYSGYTFSSVPLALSLAPIGGVYALSALYILIAYLLARHNLRVSALLCMGILLFAPATPRGESTKAVAVTAVTTHNSSFLSATKNYIEERTIALYAYLHQSLQPTDILVLPEDTRFTTTLPSSILAMIPASVIVDSSRSPEQPARSLVRTFTQKDEATTTHYAKMLLSPTGEYLPMWMRVLFPLLGLHETVDRFQQYKVYTHGDAVTKTPLTPHADAGVTMCSEIYSPIIQARMARQSQLLINLASHASLHGSSWLYTQIQAMSRVRAAENDRFLIQSVNANNSFIVDNYGAIVAQTNADAPYALLSYNVALRDNITPFSRAPCAVPILSLIVLLGYYAKRRLW